MNHDQKLLLRQAIAIHHRLTSPSGTIKQICLPVSTYERCDQLLQRFRCAHRRGWRHAALEVHRDLDRMLRQLEREIAEVQRLLSAELRENHRASVRDVHEDLIALEQEFEEVNYERPSGTTIGRAGTLSVTTEPIELGGICLGPFQICIDWDDLAAGYGTAYRVIALDPNPASSNSSVTHPHVQDQQLCEGEGRQAIQQALQEGRLFDFFTLVASVLRNYNPESPFVSLAIWNGSECADCGGTVLDDDRWYCERCEDTVCGECMCHCEGCECVYCGDCTAQCPGCEERSCQECLRRCAGCREALCRGCLDDNERCTDCNDQSNQEQNETHEASVDAGATPAAAGAAVQSHGLGQALVPA